MSENGVGKQTPFINPNDLSVSQSDLDTLRRIVSEDLSQSQLSELWKLVLKLQASLIDKQKLFEAQFQKLTQTELFRRAVNIALNTQQQASISIETKPKPPMPIPMEPKPKPQQKFAKNEGVSKRPRGNNKEIKQDKPKRQNNKPDKPKELKRIDLTIDKPIWGMTDLFLNPIPSDYDLKTLLEVTIDNNPEIPKEEHWNQRLLRIITNPREGRVRQQIKLPPAPPPADNEISEYWQEQVPSFQVEDQQMLNSGAIHRLLSSLVVTLPLESKAHTKKPFLRINPLPPKIPFNHYFSLSYEQRLSLELESLGLSTENCVMLNSTDGPFKKELDSYRQQLAEIKPKLDEYYNKISSEINDYRRKEQYRNRMNSQFLSLVHEYNLHASK
ncbi:hypothetical protein TVAG_064140 [Trichomonas vaginalis G3]|uniref:Uncharacterized protein n=1 Tax=Trichomonas vaginalis (strain ATCC PRA-98 / G3) TaxID=412133 RepID=A2FBX4_TRIV3|nr:hypothetical protein TVAGG3_0488710 [Trichomonas vaginalis G3]EAX97573.1 hypothetical protein TVAG_064140 [Trichomonas vaginalis G3]KAI5516226.1 hypothetical protein TVAGG3_0488710 [Trichomonas vaginalis G3]|eukprot:XP_001310503.1 hypothetical protein [Trichomonas vaginalis G3]